MRMLFVVVNKKCQYYNLVVHISKMGWFLWIGNETIDSTPNFIKGRIFSVCDRLPIDVRTHAYCIYISYTSIGKSQATTKNMCVVRVISLHFIYFINIECHFRFGNKEKELLQ